jgi:hypothetical protein
MERNLEEASLTIKQSNRKNFKNDIESCSEYKKILQSKKEDEISNINISKM